MSDQDSRSISDYFPVKATDFKTGVELPVNIYLYFTKNSHIMAWKQAGDVFDEGSLQKVLKSNIQNLYVLNADRELWNKYCATRSPDEKVISKEACFIAAAMSSSDLDDENRKNLLRMAGLELMRSASLDESLDQKHHLKQTSEALIALQLEEKSPGLSLLWAIAQSDPVLVHARNVASLSLAFALVLGKNDRTMLSELMAAALLHDLGLSYVDVQKAAQPIQSQTEENRDHYLSHVAHSLEIINQLLPKASVKVRNMIQLHHEKFGPIRLKKSLSNYPDLIYSQILALAEMVENVSNGMLDGTKRNLKETFQHLFEREQAGDFPNFFDPGIFLPIYQAIHGVDLESLLKKAKPVVKAYIDQHPLSRPPESDI